MGQYRYSRRSGVSVGKRATSPTCPSSLASDHGAQSGQCGQRGAGGCQGVTHLGLLPRTWRSMRRRSARRSRARSRRQGSVAVAGRMPFMRAAAFSAGRRVGAPPGSRSRRTAWSRLTTQVGSLARSSWRSVGSRRIVDWVSGSIVRKSCQQVGNSLGVALLNTIAATAAANYIADHGTSVAAHSAGLVHGYDMALHRRCRLPRRQRPGLAAPGPDSTAGHGAPRRTGGTHGTGRGDLICSDPGHAPPPWPA